MPLKLVALAAHGGQLGRHGRLLRLGLGHAGAVHLLDHARLARQPLALLLALGPQRLEGRLLARACAAQTNATFLKLASALELPRVRC